VASIPTQFPPHTASVEEPVGTSYAWGTPVRRFEGGFNQSSPRGSSSPPLPFPSCLPPNQQGCAYLALNTTPTCRTVYTFPRPHGQRHSPARCMTHPEPYPSPPRFTSIPKDSLHSLQRNHCCPPSSRGLPTWFAGTRSLGLSSSTYFLWVRLPASPGGPTLGMCEIQTANSNPTRLA